MAGEQQFIVKGRLPAAPQQYDRENEQKTRRIIELLLIDPTAGEAGEFPEFPLLDAVDRNQGSSGQGVTILKQGMVRNSSTDDIFWKVNQSGGHAYVYDSGNGMMVRRSATADGSQCLIPEWPIFSKWSSLGVTANVSSQLVYRFSCAMKQWQTSGGQTAEIGLRSGPQRLSNGSTVSFQGYILHADGGVWVPKRRISVSGSIETLTASTSLSTDVLRRLQIEYVEGPVPELTFSLDGQVVYSVTGEAAMPPFPTSGVGYGPSVADNILTLDARLTIDVVARAAVDPIP